MNEPAMFCTPEGVAELKEYIKDNFMDKEEAPGFVLGAKVKGLANNPEDYKRFYHNVNGQKIRHDKVHNLFGYNMTRAAGEAFEKIAPGKRFLMFSRSSYVGMTDTANLDGSQQILVVTHPSELKWCFHP